MSNYTPESEKYGDSHMTFIMHAFPDQHFLQVGTGQHMKVWSEDETSQLTHCPTNTHTPVTMNAVYQVIN